MPLDTWGGAAASDTCNNAWLWRVMQKEKNKDMIAMLEDNLQTFVQDATQTLLYFPPRNAFHRRVCYAVARRYGLDHRLEEHRDPDRPHAGVGETVRLVLIKTPHSATPPARLAEFAAGPPPVEKISSLPNSSDLPISCSATNKGAGNTAKEKAASAPKPATFLRRPRSADGKTGRMPIAASSNTAAGGPAALRSISEEDYQKARARIFKGPRSESGSDSLGEEQLTTDLSKTKIGGIAKGPVEGSTGFERRRNRRSVMQPQQNDKSQKRSSERNDGALHAPTSDVCKNTGKQAQPHTRPPRAYDYRLRHGYGGLSGSNSNLVPGQHGNGGRRQAGHASNNRNDLQDPDFDRCYDKWAVRPAPASHASQQMQVPVFNQLLSPYSIQPGPQMHAGNVHMRVLNAAGQVQQGVGQYQAMMHQAPSSAMMYGHVGQGVNSGGGEYGEGLRESVGYDMSGADVLSSAHSQGFGHLQNQGLPGQLGRKQSPTYGLDSTVDFPPLP